MLTPLFAPPAQSMAVTAVPRANISISVIAGRLVMPMAHRALEHLQQSRHMEKWEVYIWLQAKLGLNDQQAHIGMFSDGMCDEVIRLCYKAAAPLGNLHSAA